MTLSYALPQPGEVTVAVYNALGQVVRRLAEGHRPVGYHRLTWDGRDDAGQPVASGAYLVRMQAGAFSQMRKITRLK